MHRLGWVGAARAAALTAAIVAAAPGCRCAGGGVGENCRVNSDCDPGLYCVPTTLTCEPPPTGADSGGGVATDSGGGPGTDSGVVPGTDAGFDCGNGVCGAAETCASCPADCGDCPDPCGDGLCAGAPTEDCQSCAVDCGSCCGNGACQDGLGENCTTCAVDCGACPDPCPNGTCQPTLGETCSTCPADCGACCGNGACEPGLGESCSTCAGDCGTCCGNAVCDAALGETCSTCPGDCSACPVSCPNGACGAGETCATCPADCGACCGNGLCQSSFGETCATCPGDCGPCMGSCGNGMVDPGESCDPPAPGTCDSSCQIISACGADVGTFTCGDVVMGTNSMVGSTSVTSSYSGCPGFIGESGPEVAYTFVTPVDQTVTFNLTGLSADLDLGLLTGPPPCDPSTCIDFSYSGGLTAENVGPVTALAGQPYYVIVEGFGGSMGSFTLSASCAAPPPPPPSGTGTCADPFVLDGSASFTLIDDRNTCTAGNDSSAPALSDCTGAGNGGDLVYRLDLAFAASVTLDFWDNDGTVPIDTVLYVRSACSSTTAASQLACNDDTGGQPRHAHLDLMLAAGTYYIIADESDYVDAGTGASWTCGNVELTVSVF
ncbi:MAG TPA: hypothetical protein VG389_14310 [Myxococcota bacterium]|nr:hypothetical protein [Myxococcota bacterium]